MDLLRFIFSIFKIFKRKTNSVENFQSNEKVEAFRQLSEQEHEEMRIPELEQYVKNSFDANGCYLTYMENKVTNIAGHMSLTQELTSEKIHEAFSKGIMICDQMHVDPSKISQVAQYFCDNYYSYDKHLQYYTHTKNVIEKYSQLREEIEKKYS